ncbi:unnamed protein product [Calypogeia fissa]
MARIGKGSAFLVLLFALGLLAASANVATATTFQVGGGVVGEWTIPSTANKLDYQTWADSQKFNFGDELVFNYQNDTHDVVQVANATAYAACDANPNDAIATYDSGEDVIELTEGPEYYFICGSPGHCAAGQKFHITVGPYTPAPEAPTIPTIASPPPPSGSPRFLPRIGVVILSVAIPFCTSFAL